MGQIIMFLHMPDGKTRKYKAKNSWSGLVDILEKWQMDCRIMKVAKEAGKAVAMFAGEEWHED